MKPKISSIQALHKLVSGNQRFVEGFHQRGSLSTQKMQQLALEGQNPFAIILTCSDSRVPAEIIFNCDFGDVFVIRVAGNVAEHSQIASIEYACMQLNCSLCVVMGHTNCGAVQAAAQTLHSPTASQMSPHMGVLVDYLKPAVERAFEKTWDKDKSSFLDLAIRENVENSIVTLKNSSTALRSLVEKKSLQIVGSVYDIQTGVVSFEENMASQELFSDLKMPYTYDRRKL